MGAVTVTQSSGFGMQQNKKSLFNRSAEEAWSLGVALWQIRPRRLPLQKCCNTTTTPSPTPRPSGPENGLNVGSAPSASEQSQETGQYQTRTFHVNTIAHFSLTRNDFSAYNGS